MIVCFLFRLTIKNDRALFTFKYFTAIYEVISHVFLRLNWPLGYTGFTYQQRLLRRHIIYSQILNPINPTHRKTRLSLNRCSSAVLYYSSYQIVLLIIISYNINLNINLTDSV